jgi:hypothetical protein
MGLGRKEKSNRKKFEWIGSTSMNISVERAKSSKGGGAKLKGLKLFETAMAASYRSGMKRRIFRS